MRAERVETVVGAAATVVLLIILAVTTGLGPSGQVAGLAAGWGMTSLLAVVRRRRPKWRVGPADWVTLTRAVLAAGIAGLVADAFVAQRSSSTALVVLACIALVLDGVDGQVARRTGTASPLGARFDAEVDAFLILVLSVLVSREYGSWVLAIGAARYALLAAGWVIRWLAAPLAPRFSAKVVAAAQGIVLTAAASGRLSRLAGMIATAVALLLLAQSFGHDIARLYRAGASPRTRTVVRRSTTVVAALVVWAALVAPDRLDRLTPAAFARIPLEALVLVTIGLLLPPRPRRAAAAVAGLAVGLLVVVKILDMAFNAELGRPFNPVLDWSNLGLGIGVVRDSIGAAKTDSLLVLVGGALVLLVAVITASTMWLSTTTARHRRGSARGVIVLGVLWVTSAALSLQVAPGTAVASVSTAGLAVTQVQAAETAIHDQQQFSTTLHRTDPYTRIPGSELLSGLRGKDVLLVFVESYGQVAVEHTSFSPGVDRVLRAGTATLARAGYSTRSAFLTSPTYGGMSWIAHSTLQSGMWIDDQPRFDALMASRRMSISSAFRKAGWRTVSDNPADKRAWPDGTSFYRYDQLYGRHDVGYRGPSFSWAAMPDQYTLASFQRLELGRGHAPVMAEIDLVSSHTPWTPLPRMVPWNRLGDGSVFDAMPGQGLTPEVAWQNSATVRRLYGESIQYSMTALTSWIARLHDDNLVVVLLGDHQPSATVSGYGANHDVPISIVAHDPAAADRIAAWHWQDGLLPGPGAPVWPMDAFRDRFLDAFSSGRVAEQLRPTR